MSAPEQDRLVSNIDASLAGVSRDEIVERLISHLRMADPDYGARVAKAVRELKAKR